MYATGFLEQKKRSPVSLAAVIGLHAAALGAVILYGTTTFQKAAERRLTAINITEPQIPPEVTPPPPRPEAPRQLSTPTVTPPVLSLPSNLSAQVTPTTIYQPPLTPPAPIIVADATPVIPPPVRRAAQVDPNFRAALQPPYPAIEERAQREGQVRVRITIDANGRVTAIDQLSATSDAFWRVTQRQALSRWRFRPATVDGRPVESTMLFTVTFRLPEA